MEILTGMFFKNLWQLGTEIYQGWTIISQLNQLHTLVVYTLFLLIFLSYHLEWIFQLKKLILQVYQIRMLPTT